MNSLAKIKTAETSARHLMQEALESIVILLSPIVPHICHVLWRELKPSSELLDQPWPEADSSALVQDEIKLIVQVNGKLRGQISITKDTAAAEIERIALNDAQIQKYIDGKSVKKVIVVPGRLVNIVV